MFGGVAAAAAAAPLIPFGRVWSFPSKIVVPRRDVVTLTLDRMAGADFAFGPVGNSFLRTEWISAEVLRMMQQNAAFDEIRAVQDRWSRQPLRIGTTLRVRMPQRFLVRDSILDIGGITAVDRPARRR